MSFQVVPETETKKREAELREQDGRATLVSARWALICLLSVPLSYHFGLSFFSYMGVFVGFANGVAVLFFVIKALVHGIPARHTRSARNGLCVTALVIPLLLTVYWITRIFL